MEDYIFISKWAPKGLFGVFMVAILAIGTPFLSLLDVRAQAVGIGIAVPDTSALLELQSTSQGFLIPRMTDAQIQAIYNPVKGDIAYSTTSNNFFFYNGYFWTELIGYGWSLTGNSGTSPSTNLLGTIDSEDFVIRTNLIERMDISSGSGSVALTSNSNVAQQLRFYEPSDSGSAYTGIKAGALAGNVDYLLPVGDGVSGSALTTNGSDTLNWKVFGTLGNLGSLWQSGTGSFSLLSDSSSNSASSSYAVTAGLKNTVSGQYANAWGESNKVSGSGGNIAGGDSNTAGGNYASVRGGRLNSASVKYSVSFGGLYNREAANYAVTLGGDSNYVQGSNSAIINGPDNTIQNNNSLLFASNANVSALSNPEIVFEPSTTQTRFGIGTCSPAQAADVVGDVKFSGALKPKNSAGSSSQWLFSGGSGTYPTWGTAYSISTTNWGLTGTSDSSPSTYFIGTTDTQSLAMRTNDVERARISSIGFVGVGTSAPLHQLQSVYSSTSDETAAIYGNANGDTTAQSVGVWGSEKNTSSSNTGTLGVLCTGGGNTTAGSTNSAVQVSQGEFTMGRTSELSSLGTTVEPAASGTAYSQEGASGVVQLSLGSDLHTTPPSAGVYQDLSTVTINNEFISASSIIVAGVVAKTWDSLSANPKNSIYRVDVASRSTGSCVIRIGMMPFQSSSMAYTPNDFIRVAYAVINPGR